MLGSEIDLQMHVQNVAPSLKLRIKLPLLDGVRQFRNLIANTVGMKHDVDNRKIALQTANQPTLCMHLKFDEFCSPNCTHRS